MVYQNIEKGWNQPGLAVFHRRAEGFQGQIGAEKMRNPTDRAYYERRAAEERQRARAARNHCAANMHRDLALEYERRAEALSRSEQPETIAAE